MLVNINKSITWLTEFTVVLHYFVIANLKIQQFFVEKRDMITDSRYMFSLGFRSQISMTQKRDEKIIRKAHDLFINRENLSIYFHIFSLVEKKFH